MVPLKMIEKLFTDDSDYVLPEYRAQRRLNESRIPVICKYILDNPDSYVFSALAATIDGKHCFKDGDIQGVGILEVSMDAFFLINDGQHRKAAILEALKKSPALGEETIPIVFFEDTGLQRSQQIFTDLNKNAVKTSNSIAELYDSRDELAIITRNTIQQIDFINSYTDKEKDNLGKYAPCLFSLNMFYNANRVIIGKHFGKYEEQFLFRFWSSVVENMEQWQELSRKEISKKALRENYIATQNVVLQALGRIGNYYYIHPAEDMLSGMKKLADINWKRSSKNWNMRAIKNGRVLTNQKAIILIANVIKCTLLIPLSEDEEAVEQDFINNR